MRGLVRIRNAGPEEDDCPSPSGGGRKGGGELRKAYFSFVIVMLSSPSAIKNAKAGRSHILNQFLKNITQTMPGLTD